MAKKRKQYVRYAEVGAGLCRPWDEWWRDCDPAYYVRTLKRETGLSYPKIAHDLRKDSGVDVSDQAVYLWGRGK